jgi:hypothetical protein
MRTERVEGVDEHGAFIATVQTHPGGKTCEYRWYLNCPRCGADRSGLLGAVHDFGSDCPRCRGGATGPGPTGPTGTRPISARNARRLTRQRAKGTR